MARLKREVANCKPRGRSEEGRHQRDGRASFIPIFFQLRMS